MLEIGSLVGGKYKILSEIGHGGMSVVYMAINEKANKTWAIKEVRKDGIKDFEVVRQGLIVETDLLKKLKHPNLPSIVDVIDDENSFLIVMDYIEGNPLSKALEEYGAQPQEYVIEWAKQLCDVLGYLHTRKPPIIYRDMKPANVMLKPDGNIMLIDFGTAREFKEKNLADTVCLGTMGYAAPEQFGGMGQTDARTDIYCLGATLYHLVTGCNPSEPPYEMRPIKQINPSLSSGLERIILKCTQRNPDDRYQSCEELRYALDHYNEIDVQYRKGQKRKLFSFIGAAGLSILFGATSVFGYVGAENKKAENYDSTLTMASNPNSDEDSRQSGYLAAIEIDPTDERAYEQMINMFTSSTEESGAFSKSEAGIITQLKAGMDIKGNQTYTKTVYPLDELKAKNAKGYAKVCNDIGDAYWYDYEISSERYASAEEWFRASSSYYPSAVIYCDIGQCQQQIKKYEGQNRTEKMYEAYKTLWDKLKELNSSAADQEADTKVLVWKEIVGTISNQASYFVINTSKDEMISVLDNIGSDAQKLKNGTKYEALQKNIEDIIAEADSAKSRVEAASADGGT